MRPLPLLTLALLALAGCSSLAADLAPFDPVPSAQWRPGYHFSYATSSSSRLDGTAAAGGHAIPIHESHDSAPSPFLSYGILNTEVQKDGEAYALAALDGSHGLVAFRLRDLQPMQVGLTQSNGQPDLLLQPPAFDHSLLRFPMAKGDAWSGRLPLPEMAEVGLSAVELSSLVRGAEPLQTALGPFTAIRTEHLFSSPDARELVEAARKEAEAEGVRFSRYEVGLDARIIVQYVPELHNVARLATSVKVDIDLAAEVEGQPTSFKAHGEFEMVQELLAATLEEGPQVSLAEIAKDGYGGARLPGAVGPSPGKPASSLRLTASDRSIDLPGGSTTLRVAANGLEGTPRISVLDADGGLVASASGSAFEFIPPAAGRYLASAALDGRESAPVHLVVDYEAELEGACPLSIPVAMAAACDSVPLQLSAGVAQLTLAVRGGGADLGGELVWTDGSGKEQRFQVLQSFSGRSFEVQNPPAGLGSLRYEPTVGLPGSSVTYSLHAQAAEGPFRLHQGAAGPASAALRLGASLAGLLTPEPF